MKRHIFLFILLAQLGFNQPVFSMEKETEKSKQDKDHPKLAHLRLSLTDLASIEAAIKVEKIYGEEGLKGIEAYLSTIPLEVQFKVYDALIVYLGRADIVLAKMFESYDSSLESKRELKIKNALNLLDNLSANARIELLSLIVNENEETTRFNPYKFSLFVHDLISYSTNMTWLTKLQDIIGSKGLHRKYEALKSKLEQLVHYIQTREIMDVKEQLQIPLNEELKDIVIALILEKELRQSRDDKDRYASNYGALVRDLPMKDRLSILDYLVRNLDLLKHHYDLWLIIRLLYPDKQIREQVLKSIIKKLISLYPRTISTLGRGGDSFEGIWSKANYIFSKRLKLLLDPIENIDAREVGNQFFTLTQETGSQFSYDIFFDFLREFFASNIAYKNKLEFIKNLLSLMLDKREKELEISFIPLLRKLYMAGLEEKDFSEVLKSELAVSTNI